jgi:hypothetical protein
MTQTSYSVRLRIICIRAPGSISTASDPTI